MDSPHSQFADAVYQAALRQLQNEQFARLGIVGLQRLYNAENGRRADAFVLARPAAPAPAPEGR